MKLVEGVNPHNITTNNKDWTVYKKGNKNKLIFLHMTGVTEQEYPLQIEISKMCEIRSIKIGFPAASFEFNDKLVVSPSSVTVEGGTDLNHYQPIG